MQTTLRRLNGARAGSARGDGRDGGDERAGEPGIVRRDGDVGGNRRAERIEEAGGRLAFLGRSIQGTAK